MCCNLNLIADWILIGILTGIGLLRMDSRKRYSQGWFSRSVLKDEFSKDGVSIASGRPAGLRPGAQMDTNNGNILTFPVALLGDFLRYFAQAPFLLFLLAFFSRSASSAESKMSWSSWNRRPKSRLRCLQKSRFPMWLWTSAQFAKKQVSDVTLDVIRDHFGVMLAPDCDQVNPKVGFRMVARQVQNKR